MHAWGPPQPDDSAVMPRWLCIAQRSGLAGLLWSALFNLIAAYRCGGGGGSGWTTATAAGGSGSEWAGATDANMQPTAQEGADCPWTHPAILLVGWALVLVAGSHQVCM